jgi:hypothetical protein
MRAWGSATGPVAAWGRLGERSVEVEFVVLGTTERGPVRLATVRTVYVNVGPGGEIPRM